MYMLCDTGGGLVIITGTRSKNEPSAAAILNSVLTEYFGRGLKHMHKISHAGRQLKSGDRGTV